MPNDTERGFIPRPTTQIIASAVQWARDRRRPSLIVGVGGIGKTTTLRHIASTTIAAHLLTITTSRNSNKNLLEAVARSFGLHSSREHAADIEEVIWAHMPMAADYGHFIMVDEAQNLDLDALRSLLFLNDEFRIPIVVAGNHQVLKQRRTKTSPFDTINGRLFYRVSLEAVSREDVVAFAIEYDVEGKDAQDLLVRFGLASSLRDVAAVLEEARVLVGPSKPIRLPDVKEAISFLRGSDAVRTLATDKKRSAA